MSIKKSEYDEMIRKKPSLRPTEETRKDLEAMGFTCKPTEVISVKNIHIQLGGGIAGPLGIIKPNPSLEQEKPVKTPPEAIKSPKLLKFTIPGQPVGKPRMTQQDKWMKRPIVMRYWKWAELARSSVPKNVDLGIYRQISFIAFIGFPKSYSLKRRTMLHGEPHLSRGDGDNILKAIQDSLFKQDCVIWKFSGEKRWEDSGGARIEVELR